MSLRCIRQFINRKKSFSSLRNLAVTKRQESSVSTNEPEIKGEKNLGGFAKAFVKQSQLSEEPAKEDIPFPTLLRNSKFIDLGDPEGRIVTGTVFHTVDNDLYIDFGWKFHCVCTRPSKNGSYYVRGAKVKLRIKDLELSTKFLGSEKDLTLLEADAQLLGLVYSPVKPETAKVT